MKNVKLSNAIMSTITNHYVGDVLVVWLLVSGIILMLVLCSYILRGHTTQHYEEQEKDKLCAETK